MKVAIVQDWLTGLGGEVNVLRELIKIFPEATIYTSVYNEEALPEFKELNIQTTFLQNVPLARTKHQLFGPLRQIAFERLDLSDYDLVFTQTTAEGKAVKTRDDQLHICYCNSPTRYYWSHYDEYRKNPGLGKLNLIAKAALPLLITLLRKRDLKAAARPDHYIANSHEIQGRIERYYKRGSTVIFPPVDTSRFTLNESSERSGFVVLGRQVPYKRIDLAVQACTELNLPLTVLGNGPAHEQLKSIAGPTVTFEAHPSDEQIVKGLQNAKALLFTNLEDFGIVPVEAMACGTPVIAYGKGGALDTVKDGVSGVFFNEQSVDSLKQAIASFNEADFNANDIRQWAQTFRNARFRKEIRRFVELKRSATE